MKVRNGEYAYKPVIVVTDIAVELIIEMQAKKDESKPKLKYDTLVWEIFSSANEKIRTIRQPSPEDNGVSRMTWSMTAKGVQRPSREKLKPTTSEPNGLQVLPGIYKVRLTAGDQKDSTMITVKSDPRFNVSQSILESRHTMLKELERFEHFCKVL